MIPFEIIKQWLAAINAHEVKALVSLMTEDFVFVDSLGNRVDGAKKMAGGWQGYFAMCPDFWVRGDNMAAQSETVLIAGEAGGTIDGQSWRTPAAWKAVVRGRSVSEWQIFADNKPVYEILARRLKRP